PRRARVPHAHQPVHPQQPGDRGPEHREGPDHRRRRAVPEPRPARGHLTLPAHTTRMATMPDPLEPRALGPSTLGRRGLLAGALAVGAGAALAACISNTPPPAAAPAPAPAG